MFKTILIANRGEIACRIIKTARRLGVRTVAVYSDADREALHVAMADEAVRIGPAAAAESYLNGAAILEAARATGAQALHPGYGFLSERADFCERLEANGIVFIGPKAKAIRAMGDKIEAKLFARAAGVSIVPGHLGVVADGDAAVRIAAEIGYPVMIKASAGGGGKGMRVAWDEAGCREGFERAGSEARSSFGDDRIFIEKFVVEPRHIEIQLLADAHGNAIHLGERECSIQRRNQKIVEEAPSPFLDEATRQAMGAEAVALAKAVGYQSAGTVEFIVDKNRDFYFLEMNTRLQVEHPVTELVTGLDLVEEMLRIAAGEPLRVTQGDVRLTGWAVESRIYAEDPFRNFVPSTGRLTRYRPPAEGLMPIGADGAERAVVRNDTGVVEGSDIAMFYDPLIAKLCTHAATRLAAIDAMIAALDRFEMDGILHNIPFLAALMRHPRWREGRLSTAFIAEEFPGGFARPVPSAETAERATLIAAAIEILHRQRLAGHRDCLRPHDGNYCGPLEVRIGEEYRRLQVDAFRQSASGWTAEIRTDSVCRTVASRYRLGERAFDGTIDGQPVYAQVRLAPPAIQLVIDGVSLAARPMSSEIAALDRLMPAKREPDTSKLLLCPMPGLVVAIPVKAGQAVRAGETLAIVEAMKMENVLRAEQDVQVVEVRAAAGDSLAVDAVIMDLCLIDLEIHRNRL